jgi:hypothetical protein
MWTRSNEAAARSSSPEAHTAIVPSRLLAQTLTPQWSIPQLSVLAIDKVDGLSRSSA